MQKITLYRQLLNELQTVSEWKQVNEGAYQVSMPPTSKFAGYTIRLENFTSEPWVLKGGLSIIRESDGAYIGNFSDATNKEVSLCNNITSETEDLAWKVKAKFKNAITEWADGF